MKWLKTVNNNKARESTQISLLCHYCTPEPVCVVLSFREFIKLFIFKLFWRLLISIDSNAVLMQYNDGKLKDSEWLL